MASAAKTPYLQLNQWKDTDPVMRLDFNADNQKIDDALAAVLFRRVLDITTTDETARIDLPLGRSVSDFQELNVFISGLKHNSTNLVIDYDALLQNQTTNYIGYVGSISVALHRLYCSRLDGVASFTHIKLVACEPNSNAQSTLYSEAVCIYTTGTSTADKYYRRETQSLYYHDPADSSLPLEQIDTINLVSRNASAPFQPGARIKIWGILK